MLWVMRVSRFVGLMLLFDAVVVLTRICTKGS